MQKYNKAVAAILGGIAMIAGNYGLDLGLTPEVTAALATAISTVLVYAVPNK